MHPHWSLTDGLDGTISKTVTTITEVESTALTAPHSSQRFCMTGIIATNPSTTMLTLTLYGTDGIQFNAALAALGGGFSHSFRKPYIFGAGSLKGITDIAPDVGLFVTLVGFWL